MPCHLEATGRNFDVDRFLKQTELKPYLVFRKGEPRFKHIRKDELMKYSGLRVNVSKAGFNNLGGQIQGAIRFLKKNKTALRKLSGFPGVKCVYLDFGYEWREAVAQFDYLPTELIRLAGLSGIGIEMSLYLPCAKKGRKKRI